MILDELGSAPFTVASDDPAQFATNQSPNDYAMYNPRVFGFRSVIASLLAVMMCTPVFAKQFSVKCSGGGFNYYVTFDTNMSRVVRAVEIGGLKKGRIASITSNEIHFEIMTVGAPTRKLVWNEQDKTVTWLAGPNGDTTQSHRVDECEHVELRPGDISNYDYIAPYTEPLHSPSR